MARIKWSSYTSRPETPTLRSRVGRMVNGKHAYEIEDRKTHRVLESMTGFATSADARQAVRERIEVIAKERGAA